MTEISEEVKKFLEHKLSDGFGCDIEKVISACKGRARFSAWLGEDEQSIKEIFRVVKETGMSPELFAAKEIQEGYNYRWGWHNHTEPKGNPTQDAIFVVNHTKEVSNSNGGVPAWDDPGGGTVGVVPKSVQDEGNSHYASLSSGSIGRAYVAMTAAATWSMYYPPALTIEVNGVQNYSNPLQGCIDLIKEWGGSITGNTQSSSTQAPPVNTSQPSTSNSSNRKRRAYYVQNGTFWRMNK